MAELDESPFETEATRTEATGAPVFEDAIAYLDCTVDAAHPAGDHTIYVGRVESADILDPDATALTFFRGEWGSLDA
jgi:flavin reductase (DIM6/NTAB) family NADH-FMN oxidoreductase RutF